MQTTTTTTRWQLPAGVLAVATAGIGAVFTVTPAAGSQPDPDPGCRAEVSASGPLLRLCEQTPDR